MLRSGCFNCVEGTFCSLPSCILCVRVCVCVTGSGGVPTGGEERAGEYETGPGEADQNAGVRSQTREVKPGNSRLLSTVVIMFCMLST